MVDFKTIDDYTKLPDGYTDYDFEHKFEEIVKEALESISKEMIKSRLVNMPKIYVVSSVPLNRESLLHGFIKMNPILPNQESYYVVAYFEPNYRILKRRLTHGRRGSIKKFKLHKKCKNKRFSKL